MNDFNMISRHFKWLLGMFLLSLAVSCRNKSQVLFHDPLDLTAIDSTVNPVNDFFQFANGSWIKSAKIPASQAGWGSFYLVRDDVLGQIRNILDSVSRLSTPTSGTIAQLAGDLYASSIDSARINELGFKPIAGDLNRIDAIKNAPGLLHEIAIEYTEGLSPLFRFYPTADDKNSDWEIARFNQGGLGLPNRDYYFSKDTAIISIRNAYAEYIRKILVMLGGKESSAGRKAADIIRLETELAKASKTPVEMRDPNANYHKVTVPWLTGQIPQFRWNELLPGMKIHQDTVIMGQPDFYKATGQLIAKTSLDTWKDYLRFHLADEFSPYLSDDFVNTKFEFDRRLSGQSEMQARWKRMSRMVDSQLGDALGQLYVSRYFPSESKKRMDALVENLIQTYAERIQGLAWMSDSTKAKALLKLHAIVRKIGYPAKWKDYSSVRISRDSLVENIKRCSAFDYAYETNKIGKPVDRSEWFMTPPTVNAYYSATSNDINFPAGILQPPFFFANGDDAVNYGAIGVVIGHEMTHGFDDRGRQYDARGNLKNWWMPSDAEKFTKEAALVVDQYNHFTVLDSLPINGKLTLGENIADIGGLAIAYAAFRKTAEGQSTEKIDGLTPDQRFFLSLAQIWRSVIRPESLRTQILTNPHSPSKFRVNGPVSNTPSFYAAFNVRPGNRLYRPDSLRVNIW